MSISKDRERILWDHIEKFREDGRILNFPSIIESLRETGEQLNIHDLMFIQEHIFNRRGEFVLPLSVASFFSQLTGSRPCKSVLDPAGGNGLLGAWLAENSPIDRMDVVSLYAEGIEIIQALDIKSLTLQTGTVDTVGPKLVDTYDAIVSLNIPIGQPREKKTYEIGDESIELRDDPSCLLIADVADRLSSDGFLAFVMPSRFAWEKGPHSVKKNLAHFGLHLSTLLSFRPGIFPFTNISFNLAIITRERHNELFVASIPKDADAQKALIDRLWNRKPSTAASQGWLVPEKQFHGLQGLIAQNHADDVAKGKGFSPVPVNIAVKEIRCPTRTRAEFEHCSDHPDAVYLPEMAKTPATTKREDLPEKLRSYFQLLVNPEIVLPEYLAELFNTPLGHSMRQSVMTGTTIPRINKSLLEKSNLYLIPVPDQRKVLEAKSKIHQLKNELSELEAKIWERPRQAGSIIEALDKVNHEERFEEWIESLPFPLASILRSYHTQDITDKDKYERLLFFFEALTEFLTAIHISAFRTDPVRWENELAALRRIPGDQALSFERATFGLWCAFFGRLAKSLRSILNNREECTVANSLYVTQDLLTLELLSSKSLSGLFQRVNSFRNSWTGHGGAVTQEEAIARHESLRKELEDLRTIVGRKFLHYQLIEPQEAEILDGPLFKCRVRLVMGSNPQLEHSQVTVTTPAKKGTLYFHNPGCDSLLELLPIIQLCDKPQPASYFYNRRENSKLRLVSYSSADKSEIESPDSVLDELFNDFAPTRLPEEKEA